MIDFNGFEVWFVTGSQHLYGEALLRKLPSIRRRWRWG